MFPPCIFGNKTWIFALYDPIWIYPIAHFSLISLLPGLNTGYGTERAEKLTVFTKNDTDWNRICFVSLCCQNQSSGSLEDLILSCRQAVCVWRLFTELSCFQCSWEMWCKTSQGFNYKGVNKCKAVTTRCCCVAVLWFTSAVQTTLKCVSLRTTGSGDPSSGCICNAAQSDVSASESHSTLQYAVWSVLYRCMSSEPYLSQTEQWWHRSGFSSWQRSQKRIAEETQPIQSHSRQQQPLLTLEHRLIRRRGLRWALRAACQSRPLHLFCIGSTVCSTVPPELVRV